MGSLPCAETANSGFSTISKAVIGFVNLLALKVLADLLPFSVPMNTTNPFQIPSCLQRADVQLRRRERFRRGVVVIVAAVVALLVVLLIEGCMSEHAKTASSSVPAVTGQPSTPAPAPVVAPKPAAVPAHAPSPAHFAVSSALTPAVAAKPVAPVAASPAQVYVVKSGDTLSRIAKQHHTSVKALKAVNGLDTDIIAVGAALKLPSV